MKYEVVFHPSAGEEVVAIKRWYLERSKKAASKFDREVEKAAAELSDHPLAWRERSPGVRQYPLRRFPFLVVYCVTRSNVVKVVAVAHGRRRPGYWKSRLGS